MAQFTARFVPEVWINDAAIACDPEGETEWDCTEGFEALTEDYRGSLLAKIEQNGEALDKWDCLQQANTAPEWVRRWSGPFDLYVRKVGS